MVPKHIGIILDGNGRWATNQGKERKDGYKAGLNALTNVLPYIGEKGIEALTVFGFSTENWKRPKDEVSSIFNTIKLFAKSHKSKCKVQFMGDIDGLPKDIQMIVKNITKDTGDYKNFTLNIALNYGSQMDIVETARKFALDGNTDFTIEDFSKNLSTGKLPPLDLVLRSGGEKRLSNFLLFEAAYAEFIFIDKFWPDFNKEDFDKVLAEYERRTRKFGGVVWGNLWKI